MSYQIILDLDECTLEEAGNIARQLYLRVDEVIDFDVVEKDGE